MFSGLALLIAMSIAGCASPTPGEPSASEPVSTPTSGDPVAAVTLQPPADCDQPSMVALINGLGFTGAEDVTPPWTPAEGTTLKLALDDGGLACAWGPPNTDAGVVVWWSTVDDDGWTAATDIMISEGQADIDVAGLDEDAAMFIFEPASDDAIFPHWELNARFDDLWIHVATSSWEFPADGNAVVSEALTLAGS